VVGGSLLVAGAMAPEVVTGQDATATPPALSPMELLVQRIPAPQPADDPVMATIEALAACGVPTWEGTSATSPIIPVAGDMAPNRLLRWQAHNLAMEIRNRGGRNGATYDAAIPIPEGTPPPSPVLAGYVATARTPGGDLARAVMGDQDWAQAAGIRFPAVIGALLLADVARETLAPTARTLAVPLGARQDGVCSSLQAWVEATIAAIFDALRLDEPDNTVGQVITGIWNFIVDIAETVAGGLASRLKDAVLSAVRAIAGLIGTASQIVSLLQLWTISVEPAPPVTAFGIGNATVSGTVLVRVTSGTMTEWPSDISDCAAVSGIPLPSLAAGEAPVTWEYSEAPIDLVSITAEPAALDGGGEAVLAYETNSESAEDATGTPHEGLLTVVPTVERDDLGDVADAILATSLAGLPAIVRDVVVPILGPMASEVVEQIAGMVTVTGSGVVTVIYHTPPEPGSTPEEIEEGTCLGGTWRIVDFIGMLNSYMSSLGATVTYTDQSGSAYFTFGPDGLFTWDAAAFAVTGGDTLAGIGSVEATVTLDGRQAYRAICGGGERRLAPGDDRRHDRCRGCIPQRRTPWRDAA
jgi:hypothetical protein